MCKVSTTSFELKATSFFISWYIGSINCTTPRRMRPLARRDSMVHILLKSLSVRGRELTKAARSHKASSSPDLSKSLPLPKEKKYDLSQVLPRLSCNPSTPLMLGHVEKVKKPSFWGLGLCHRRNGTTPGKRWQNLTSHTSC